VLTCKDCFHVLNELLVLVDEPAFSLPTAGERFALISEPAGLSVPSP
jgi:hypothetical protein